MGGCGAGGIPQSLCGLLFYAEFRLLAVCFSLDKGQRFRKRDVKRLGPDRVWHENPFLPF